MVNRARQQLIAAGNLFDLEGGAVGIVKGLEFSEQALHFTHISDFGGGDQLARRNRLIGEHQRCFKSRQFFVSRQRIADFDCSWIVEPADGTTN